MFRWPRHPTARGMDGLSAACSTFSLPGCHGCVPVVMESKITGRVGPALTQANRVRFWTLLPLESLILTPCLKIDWQHFRVIGCSCVPLSPVLVICHLWVVLVLWSGTDLASACHEACDRHRSLRNNDVGLCQKKGAAAVAAMAMNCSGAAVRATPAMFFKTLAQAAIFNVTHA